MTERLPTAVARKDFANVLRDSAAGKRIKLTRYNKTVADTVIDQGKSQQMGSYSVTFNRESQYTLLSISQDPGQFLIWFGALLLFGGFTLVFLLPQAPRGASVSRAAVERYDHATARLESTQ